MTSTERTLRAGRHFGKSLDADRVARNVVQDAVLFEEQVVVVGNVGVEIGAVGIQRDALHQAGGHELVQRVVDRGQRHPDAAFRAITATSSAVTCRSMPSNNRPPIAIRFGVARRPADWSRVSIFMTR